MKGVLSIEKNDLKAEDLNGIYQEVAEAFDVKTACEFHVNFSGLQLTFPVKLLSREYVMKCIRSEYNGNNIRSLSRKHGYSERWIRVILKNMSYVEDTEE